MKRITNDSGFTLIEVLMAVGIVVIGLIAIMRVFLYCDTLTQISGNTTTAMAEAYKKLEEIRNSTYSDVVTNYSSGGTPGNVFNLTQLTGKGIIYIDSTNASLLQIEIVVCWQDKNGRIVGEDLDLDGVLDVGEDLDGDAKIDSKATIITYIARRG